MPSATLTFTSPYGAPPAVEAFRAVTHEEIEVRLRELYRTPLNRVQGDVGEFLAEIQDTEQAAHWAQAGVPMLAASDEDGWYWGTVETIEAVEKRIAGHLITLATMRNESRRASVKARARARQLCECGRDEGECATVDGGEEHGDRS